MRFFSAMGLRYQTRALTMVRSKNQEASRASSRLSEARSRHAPPRSVLASCFLLLASCFCLLSSVFCILSSVFCLLSSVFCLLSSVFCLLYPSPCAGSSTSTWTPSTRPSSSAIGPNCAAGRSPSAPAGGTGGVAASSYEARAFGVRSAIRRPARSASAPTWPWCRRTSRSTTAPCPPPSSGSSAPSPRWWSRSRSTKRILDVTENAWHEPLAVNVGPAPEGADSRGERG